jgi:hypothetical protein
MKSGDAEAAIRQAARDYAAGKDSLRELWSAFQSHLRDLSRDGPLSGDFLRLFQAFDLWEQQSVAPDRARAEDKIRKIAARLGDGG